MPVSLSGGHGALVMVMAAFIWGTVTVFAALRVLFGSAVFLPVLGGLYRAAIQASRDPVVLA